MITRGEQMLALRKRRMAAAHPFLRGGFRPFFFGAATWGVIAITLWLFSLAGLIVIPTSFDGVAWHRHELLFGFVGSAVAGFLLTAVPNWTGRLPIAGKPLLALFGLWAAARVAVLFSAIIGLMPAAFLDVGFFAVLAGVAGREVLAAKNRNVPVVAMVLLLALADAADYAEALGLIGNRGLGWRGAISLVVVLISLVGGRIAPSFTRNWMVKQGATHRLPTQPERFDVLVIAGTAIALVFWLVFPDERLVGAMLVIAASLQALRLARWGGIRAASDPLVLILHLGYFWIPIGLMLLGLSVATLGVPRSAAIHALTAGAMTTMILAVMTRATLGHTGHELKANALTLVLYVAVTIGGVLRVVASLGLGSYSLMLDSAGIFWAAGLLLFLVGYGPILWRPRLAETS